jgi:hypothetical protein
MACPGSLTNVRRGATPEFVVPQPSLRNGDDQGHALARSCKAGLLVPTPSTDDMVSYREVQRLPLTTLPQMSPAAVEMYEKFMREVPLTPHSRTHIPHWFPGRLGS